MTDAAELTIWRDRLINLIRQEGGDEDGAHDINHYHRVWAVAQQLLRADPTADALTVLCACYLHDLVNLPKDHPERHLASRHSAQRARVLLPTVGFPADKLDGVEHAIEAHSFSANITPRTSEARIVQDADRMDALGAIGLARLFYIAGRMGSGLAHPDNPAGEGRELDDKKWALDHIETKLGKLPGMMQTEAGRRLGQERLEQLREFRTRFCKEWLGLCE
ncbi:putative metal dependent phosphohydrolase [Paratrimastix pyriformis]|uniref:Metal dependent phosphohydrolase n=1 Tax=Paratrimastix pyriformis TaxID=342808 RepID=A0ABQ8UJ81_9EUKA|nr:putative metal dependent phosphohydrolase [Paratrimastix pyriformis]